MSQYDQLHNATLPLLEVDFTAEGESAGLDEPENVGEGFELVGTLTQPDSKIHMTHVWITELDDPQLWVKEHLHDYDEVLIWTGSDPENPRDLGAELYFEIEGERRTVTTSGSVYIPAGTRHCPLGFTKVRRPFTFSALSLTPNYKAKSAS